MEMSNVRKWGTDKTLAFGETVDRGNWLFKESRVQF